MMKLLAGLGALGTAIVVGAVIATSSGDTPENQTEAQPAPTLAPRAEASTDSQYDYQTVWALFEESCRSDEFMDNECSCMMNSVSAAHGMDAVAYLALMGWDRFDEAGVIADRLGEDRIRAAVDFYSGKADGTCDRTQTLITDDRSGTSSSTRDDAETVSSAAESGQPTGDGTEGTGLPPENRGGADTNSTTTEPPTCQLDNALSVPGNLGTPIVWIKDGEAEALTLLSGGNRQRVALAQAIASAPDLLLLDEPTINLDPTEIATLEECVIYVGGRARFGVGPQRGFTGKLTVEGSDIPVTAGAEYVVWNEADGTTTRQPINQSFTLPASQSDVVVFLAFGFIPTAYSDQSLVNLETTNSGFLANVIMRDMAMMMILSGDNLDDYRTLLARIQGLSFWQPLPLDEVLLVPPGQLELSWDESDPNNPTIKACFASQQALLNLLRDLGYDASSSLAIIGRAIREAKAQGTDVCETLKTTAAVAIFNDSIGALPISTENGPGLHLVDLSD